MRRTEAIRRKASAIAYGEAYYVMLDVMLRLDSAGVRLRYAQGPEAARLLVRRGLALEACQRELERARRRWRAIRGDKRERPRRRP